MRVCLGDRILLKGPKHDPFEHGPPGVPRPFDDVHQAEPVFIAGAGGEAARAVGDIDSGLLIMFGTHGLHAGEQHKVA